MTALPTSMSLTTHRQAFPALGTNAYFNYGGQGPLPQSAIEAIYRAHLTLQQSGPFSHAANTWINQETARTRAAIAALLHVSPATITLTENVSLGCNIPIWGMEWREGDHILLSDCEHPSVIAAVNEVQRRFGVKVSECPLMGTLNEGDPVAVVMQQVRPTTRLVIVSHILWNTGQVLPLKDLAIACHEYPSIYGPVRLLVDAAQSVGVLPLDLMDLGADFYAFTGHKWLCGPAGIGGLFVHPDALSSIHPTFVGWRAITKDETGQPTGWLPDGRRFEVATSDVTLYSGLREAIALHDTWGTAEERYQRICALSTYLWQQLRQMPQVTCLKATAPEAGLVSFMVAGEENDRHARLVRSLEDNGFLLRTIQNPDCIRASVHYLTLESELDQLVTAIQTALAH